MSKITDLLGAQADSLLNHSCKTISKDNIVAPNANFIDQTFVYSNRNPQVLRSLAQLYGTGRLANTGYMSILPVDQGIEHSAGASFAPNPIYFDSIISCAWNPIPPQSRTIGDNIRFTRSN